MEHHELQQHGFTPITSHAHAHVHHEFIPSVPVPPIPTSQLEQRPISRSLSFSKPVILRFEKFPNMNLAFYLDLFSPNDVANLSDSTTASPVLEKVMAREENHRVPLKLEQSQIEKQIPNQGFPRRGSSLVTRMPIDGLAAGNGRGENVTTFNAPGRKTDVKLVVFEREFHVHSIVLRLYSGFFRNALDAIDREGGGVGATRSFKYEFVSVGVVALDDGGRGAREGGWTLQRATEQYQTPLQSPDLPQDTQILQNGHAFPTSATQDPSEELAFNKLLSAFYNKPFSISSFQELLSLTRLAEQFSALPCLSSSLYVALWHSPILISSIRTHRNEMLLLATQLRHRLLFREALIHVVRTWEGYEGLFEGMYRLICTVTKAHNGVCEKVLKVNQEVFAVLARDEGQVGLWARMKADVLVVLRGMDTSESLTGNRRLYETLRAELEDKAYLRDQFRADPFEVERAEVQEKFKGLKDSLNELLSNKLALERSLGRVKGWSEEEVKMGFLCADIEDEDLPWDLEEEDW